MTQFIEIGGEKRPLRFGFAGLFRYEKETGRNALADFAEFQQGVEKVSVVRLVELVHAGLLAGYKAESKNVDFSLDDVADWVDDGVLKQVFDAFALSFPSSEGNGRAGKPKAAAPQE